MELGGACTLLPCRFSLNVPGYTVCAVPAEDRVLEFLHEDALTLLICAKSRAPDHYLESLRQLDNNYREAAVP